jgi:phosphoenolpyruvate synthase/pyruvate phosphate dikinase
MGELNISIQAIEYPELAVMPKSPLGGKATGLVMLVQCGARIPPSWILTTREGKPLGAYGNRLFQPRVLAGMLKAAPLSFGESLVHAMNSGPGLAVRSSLSSTTSMANSLPGALETVFFAHSIETLAKSIQTVVHSLHGPAAQAYLRNRVLEMSDFSVVPILQKIIVPRVSGVCFSRDPLNLEEDRIVIEATYGFGSGVVGGHIDVDRVYSDGRGRILEYSIGAKVTRLGVVPGGHRFSEEATPLNMRSVRCLNDQAIQRLSLTARSLERLQSYPVDLEWALDHEGIHYLQMRRAR